MTQLIFATHNAHKLREVQQMLPTFHIRSLEAINFHNEIIEDGSTFKENASIKVDAISKITTHNIFGDDSGLIIPVLNNEPGIYSSRYAGTGKSEDNIKKVLNKLRNKSDRTAYFQTVICLLFNKEKYFFEGKVEGKILNTISGKEGFGYDPIFQPDNYDVSFADLSPEEKNRISHRGIAISKLKAFLLKQKSK